MKFTLLPYKIDDLYYFISPLTGNLVVSTFHVESSRLDNEMKKNIWLNDNPYELKPPSSICDQVLSDIKRKKIVRFNNKFMWLGNKRFLLACMYASFTVPIFENTLMAFDDIAKLEIHIEKKGKICLQRSLLAAKTSKSFIKNGTLFIGAQLPTGIMHAWIIENGIQPDRNDREWIMYKPLLAITF